MEEEPPARAVHDEVGTPEATLPGEERLKQGLPFWPDGSMAFMDAVKARMSYCCPGSYFLTATPEDAALYLRGVALDDVQEFYDRLRLWSGPPMAMLNEAHRILTEAHARGVHFARDLPDEGRLVDAIWDDEKIDYRQAGQSTVTEEKQTQDEARPEEQGSLWTSGAEERLDIEELEDALSMHEAYAGGLQRALTESGEEYEAPPHEQNAAAEWPDKRLVSVVHIHPDEEVPLPLGQLMPEHMEVPVRMYLDAYAELKRRVAIRQEEV